MQSVRIGFVGAGTQFGEDLGPAFGEQEGVRMVGIADLNGDLARERARTYRMSAYSSLDEMLDHKPDIDAVVIAVPNALHERLAKKAVRRGRHVFVEKPMAWDYRAAAAMDKAARTAGCLLWVSQQYTYMWNLPAAIAAAALGPIQVVTAKFVKMHGIPDRDHFFTMRTAGGGPGMDYGPHLLSVVLPALGMPQPTLASARMWKAAGAAEHGDRFEVEDHLMGSVDFGDGPRLEINVAWAGNHEEVGVAFDGSQGALEVPLLTGQPHTPGWVPGQTAELVVRRPDREPVTLPDQPRDVWQTIRAQTADFVAAVRAHAAGQVQSAAYERAEQSQELGLRGMRIIRGLYKSARSGGRQVSLTA